MVNRHRLTWELTVWRDVAAPADAVWRVVSDVRRTGEWSHECRRVDWRDGSDAAVVGARFSGVNVLPGVRWSRLCVITAVEPGRSLTWETIATWRFVDSTRWRIAVEPLPAGTRITQEYQVLRCPGWWEWLVYLVVRPHRDRAAALAADLERLGAVASADAGHGLSPRSPQ